jgi:enoyl-CoA hydratase/carnithine racemase
VGPARALDICGTTRAIGAAEALAIGLTQRVVPTAELTTATAEYVAALLKAEPGALRELKPLLRDAADRSPADQLLAEAAAQQRLLSRLVGGSPR